jgi:hypothetical protein
MKVQAEIVVQRDGQAVRVALTGDRYRMDRGDGVVRDYVDIIQRQPNVRLEDDEFDEAMAALREARP